MLGSSKAMSSWASTGPTWRGRGGAGVPEPARHNAAFCRGCFLHHVREQVKRAIKAYAMFGPEDRVLVAVSGGKDSPGLWAVLLHLGYRVTGLYLGLGIGQYSHGSAEVARRFAEERRATLLEALSELTEGA